MGDGYSNGTTSDTLESLEAEREDLEKSVACVRQMARDFDTLTERRKLFDPNRIAFHLQIKGPHLRRCVWKGIFTPEAFQWHKAAMARKKALGEQLLRDAAAFAQALIRWAEDLEKRERRQEALLMPTPSVAIVSGANTLDYSTGVPADNVGPDESRSQDNSSGNPGVLIYTNNWNTYNRYTGLQKGVGQLPSAYVTYVGPESMDNLYLTTNVPGAIDPPTYNGVRYAYRVIINQSESWYYFSARDAQTKQEAIAFNDLSMLIPLMTGFSPASGAGGDFVDTVSAATHDAAPPVDAGIRWGAGIEAQGSPWEDYLVTIKPVETRLPNNFKTFDFFDQGTGTATSAKTLDTLTRSRVVKPAALYRMLVKYIDEVADFSSAASGEFELDVSQINSRVIEVAIPSTTTPDQMEQINAAVWYGKKRCVTVIITKTKG